MAAEQDTSQMAQTELCHIYQYRNWKTLYNISYQQLKVYLPNIYNGITIIRYNTIIRHTKILMTHGLIIHIRSNKTTTPVVARDKNRVHDHTMILQIIAIRQYMTNFKTLIYSQWLMHNAGSRIDHRQKCVHGPFRKRKQLTTDKSETFFNLCSRNILLNTYWNYIWEGIKSIEIVLNIWQSIRNYQCAWPNDQTKSNYSRGPGFDLRHSSAQAIDTVFKFGQEN